MQLSKKKKLLYDWWAGGSQAPYGLLSQLQNQTGNLSTDIKLKLGYGYSASNTNWSAASTYNASTIRTYPSDSPIAWKVKLESKIR